MITCQSRDVLVDRIVIDHEISKRLRIGLDEPTTCDGFLRVSIC